jgi:hypothetical protein
MCHGKKATLVGPGDIRSHLRGTVGDDVIVSNGATDIKGRGGDDTICLTGPGPYPKGVGPSVNAGTGNDYVVNQLGHRPVSVTLETGNDHYIGGPGRDQVNDYVDVAGQDSGKDVISTKGGDDAVTDGGFRDAHNRDTVNLGPGDDLLFFTTEDNSQATLRGGDGTDLLRSFPGETDTGDVVYDNRAENATRDGARFLSWSSFEDFTLARGSSQTFLGTGRDELVTLSASIIAADMRGGNDVIEAFRYSEQSDLLRGGPGTDTFKTYNEEFDTLVSGDLAAQTIIYSGGPVTSPERTFQLGGINSLDVTADSVRLYGDDEGNHLNALGCTSTVVKAGAGPDVVTDIGRFMEGPCNGTYGPTVFRGGAGNDRLIGATSKNQDVIRNETLLGGPGNDFANGNGGHEDVCHAEIERACELN